MRNLDKPLSAFIDELSEKVSDSVLMAAEILSDISLDVLSERVSLGMNQKEFARHMNVSQGMISKWESGSYNFTIKALCEVCEKIRMVPKLVIEKQHKGDDANNLWSIRGNNSVWIQNESNAPIHNIELVG